MARSSDLCFPASKFHKQAMSLHWELRYDYKNATLCEHIQENRHAALINQTTTLLQ